MKSAIWLLLLIATGFSLPCRSSDLLQQSLGEMRRIDARIVEPAEKAPLLEQALKPMLASVGRTGLHRLSDDEVRDLYDAARLTAFYARSAFATMHMRTAVNELERRKIAPPSAADDMIATLVAARLFKDARSYYRNHSDSAKRAPPSFTDIRSRQTSPTLLDISLDGSTLVRRELAGVKGTMVVVVGSPWCRFSRMATDAIESDPLLASVMAKNATWLISQQVIDDLPAVAAWNRAHPATSMSLIYRQSEWSFLDTTATPSFYFLRNGHLVSSFSGWPGAEQKTHLISALQAIGIGADLP